MSGSTGDVGFAGPTPSVATANPIAQQQTSQYAQMTPEQLQEMVIRLKGSPQGQLAQRVLTQKRITGGSQQGDMSGMPQPYALGGTLKPTGGIEMPERGIPAGGFLHTAGPGRTDNLGIHPHADSYVLPADVVSGLGEGNSLAGAKALDTALHTGPYGVPLPPSHVGHRMGARRGFADGGAAPERVPVEAAGGEYIVTPEQCRAIGHGDIKRGHEILDAFVLHVRKHTIKDMSSLKGPVKS